MPKSSGIRQLVKLSQQERRLIQRYEQAKAAGDYRKMLRASRVLVAVQNRVIDLARIDRFLNPD